MMNFTLGRKIRLRHPLSDGGELTFSARIVKITDDSVWVEIPARVRHIPFPPCDGKRYARFLKSDLSQKGASNG